MSNMIAHHPRDDRSLDYGLMFNEQGMIRFNPYHFNILNEAERTIRLKFITGEGALTDLVADTLDEFIRSNSFSFDSDIVKLYYAAVGRSVSYCSVDEFWR